MDSLINGIKKLINPDKICKICSSDECCIKRFQKNFKNWTSGNDDIDKLIQTTQLSSHRVEDKALEWIPYNKLYDIKHITENSYKANWIDGNICYWSSVDHNWKRQNQNMIVELKKLNNPKNIALEFKDEISIVYGITQDPETKDYIMVLNENCKLCKRICNAKYFQKNFKNWTSGNDDINKFIQTTQQSSHRDVDKALEWIPYNKLYDIKHITENSYKANWIDGNICYWSSVDHNWKRQNQNMIVELKKLNNPKNIALEFKDEISIVYGITQNPETKDYIMVLNENCKLCKRICYAKYYQKNFKNWTSGNDDINKFIQTSQLSFHRDVDKALEWIPYNKLYDIKHITENSYKANWIDGNICYWSSVDHNWKRQNQNMIVELKKLNNPKNIALEFKDEDKAYGITQDPESKNYIMVLSYKCKLCNCICNAINFQQNFNNWTSGNNDIDKFIQDTQLSSHKGVKNALEWISYNKLCNIKHITENSYKANWIDGNIWYWNNFGSDALYSVLL
ncbi:hypothetical protein RhiirA5_420827 [Rhizophagus irregularis]|uniref:Uncharacterized protein n=1 Tax=Rhizophagus irregularis TaxID=588596 RepID=A0A2N0PFC6_9GLOM|nr:hypothetical protein RhiirA5_420827 [Rhizophagus irregularis]